MQAATGVPWYIIGALHMRNRPATSKASCTTATKSSARRPHHARAGRPWSARDVGSAVDALKLKDMHRVQAWSAARMLYQAEVFNGLGYVGKGINSPYVWAGTNHEESGKYIADHVFDPNAEDGQLGVAAFAPPGMKRFCSRWSGAGHAVSRPHESWLASKLQKTKAAQMVACRFDTVVPD